MSKKPAHVTKQLKATKPAVAKSADQEILPGYDDFLRDVKTRIRSVQKQAMRAAKKETISPPSKLYPPS